VRKYILEANPRKQSNHYPSNLSLRHLATKTGENARQGCRSGTYKTSVRDSKVASGGTRSAYRLDGRRGTVLDLGVLEGQKPCRVRWRSAYRPKLNLNKYVIKVGPKGTHVEACRAGSRRSLEPKKTPCRVGNERPSRLSTSKQV